MALAELEDHLASMTVSDSQTTACERVDAGPTAVKADADEDMPAITSDSEGSDWYEGLSDISEDGRDAGNKVE